MHTHVYRLHTVRRPGNKANRMHTHVHRLHTVRRPGKEVASFLGLPFFWSSVCVDNNTRKQKQGRPERIHHVSDVRWMRGGRGVRVDRQVGRSSIS